MYYAYAATFIATLFLCWGVTVFGLPGNWLIVIATAAFAHFFPQQAGPGVSWTIVGVLAGLALLGELLEFIAGAAGMAKGGSKRGAVLAMFGSIVGGVFGAAMGIPVPVVGPLVGVLLFASLGAMGGAMLGERLKGTPDGQTLMIGKAAFWGRLFGSVAKILVGCVMIVVAAIAALW